MVLSGAFELLNTVRLSGVGKILIDSSVGGHGERNFRLWLQSGSQPKTI